MLEKDRQWANEPETVSFYVTMTGTGNGTVPTKFFGRGITLSWISTGIVQLTFGDRAGAFMGGGPAGWQAATPSQLKGFSAVFGSFDATGTIVQVSITNSSQTLVDLQTGQILTLELVFKASGSGV
jgi:hypothetical protein